MAISKLKIFGLGVIPFVSLTLLFAAVGSDKAHLWFQTGLSDNGSNPTNGVIRWIASEGYDFEPSQFIGLVHSNATTSVITSNTTTYAAGQFNYVGPVTNDYVNVWWAYTDINFYFDEYLIDNGSCATPEYVIIKWNYEIVPSYSTLFIDYRLKGSTDEYTRLGSCVVSDLQYKVRFNDDPRNYEFVVWTTYIPTPVINTNGVWNVNIYYSNDKSKKGFIVVDGLIKDGEKILGNPKQMPNYNKEK